MTKSDKFHEEDLPKILQAIKDAHDSGENARIVIDLAANGGVLGIEVEKKKRYK